MFGWSPEEIWKYGIFSGLKCVLLGFVNHPPHHCVLRGYNVQCMQIIDFKGS